MAGKRKPDIGEEDNAAEVRVTEAANGEDAPRARRSAWTRDLEGGEEGQLGERLRALRESRGMTLVEATEATGIRPGTLSRIETGKMAPSFGLILRIMKGLRLSWVELMGQERDADARPSFSFPETVSKQHLHRHVYDMLHMGSALSQTLSPVVVETTVNRLADAGGLVGHHGTEFCYVLSGKLRLHFEGEPAQELPAGASALFNGQIPHAYVAVGRTPVKMLIVVNRDPMVKEEFAAGFPLGPETVRLEGVSRTPD